MSGGWLSPITSSTRIASGRSMRKVITRSTCRGCTVMTWNWTHGSMSISTQRLLAGRRGRMGLHSNSGVSKQGGSPDVQRPFAQGRPKRSSTMALGDGIRRNIAQVEPTERTALRDAIIEMHHRFYPGLREDTPPGHVSWWFKQDEIHQATHVHGGPEFLPWHRELTNRFEALIREINPLLSLHYWDFKEDPRALPNANLGGGNTGVLNLFDPNFMGSPGLPEDQIMRPEDGQIGDPWLTAGFYDPLAGTSDHPPDREVTSNPADPPKFVTRPSNYPGPAPSPLITPGDGGAWTAARENQLLALVNYGPGAATNPGPFDPRQFFRTVWEEIHNLAHGYFADISPHNAFRDPFVYLLHSNVDRVFAMWQCDPNHPERLDPNRVYGGESNLDVDVLAVGVSSSQNL